MSESVSASVTLVFVKIYFGYWSSVTSEFLLIPPGSWLFLFKPMTSYIALLYTSVGILIFLHFKKKYEPEQQRKT